MNPKANFYFIKPGSWQKETEELRKIILSTGLTEEVKWGCPCYTFEGNNIVLIHVFKEYTAILFFKGALLKDNESLLVQQSKNVQAARQLRFNSVAEIVKYKADIKAYVFEAIEVEKAGLKVEMKKTKEFSMPEEFKQKLIKDAELKKAFESLTPGRQRGYLLYFSQAKQSKTRETRIEKYLQPIMNGKGLND